MLTPRQTCIVTIIICALVGMLGWCVTGHPSGYEPTYAAAGVAFGAIMSAVGLIGRRAALVAAADEVTSEDRPRLHLPPGTLAMRRADMEKMIEGEISLDEFVDIWSGREIVEAREHEIKMAEQRGRIEALQEVQKSLKHRVPPAERSDEQFKDDVRVALFKEIMRDPQYEAAQPACRKCLGIHETETCTAGQEKPVVFMVGDKVRVTYQLHTFFHSICTIEGFLVTVDGQNRPSWMLHFGGSSSPAYQSDIKLAFPLKGEVWNYKGCKQCEDAFNNEWPARCFDVDHDWVYCPMTRRRVAHGCLYRIGMQDKKK